MKLTRNCLMPWQFMTIHAGGMMCPCCAMGDTDYGDFILDYIEPKSEGKSTDDLFNNNAIQELKRGLLTGNLRPMCQNCALVSMNYITTDELKEKVKNHLIHRGKAVDESTDLAQERAFIIAGFGLTNKCNMRCIYCNQSVLAGQNPYFNMDFPEDYIYETLKLLASEKIDLLETGAFGEATIHPKWYPVFSRFHKEHPEIKLHLTTNLCKDYTDDEIKLLAEHEYLGVSLDTLDEELFKKIRRNGNIKLILNNLERIEKAIGKYNLNRPDIAISSVICNLTWESIKEVSDFAFVHNYRYGANSYEERYNSLGYQEGILKPVDSLPEEEQEKIRELLLRVQKRAGEKGEYINSAGDLISRVNRRYNKFDSYNQNPVYKEFLNMYSDGEEGLYTDIVYDYSNVSHEGIRIYRGKSLKLNISSDYKYFIVREHEIYKDGKCSPKYNQKVFPGYRRKIELKDGLFEFTPNFKSEDIESILLEVFF